MGQQAKKKKEKDCGFRSLSSSDTASKAYGLGLHDPSHFVFSLGGFQADFKLLTWGTNV